MLNRSFLEDDGSNKLSNAGERIVLQGSANTIISEVSYDDGRPWPISADGDGYSLTLMMPGINDPVEARSWRSSFDLGGSPGFSDFVPLQSWVESYGGVSLLNDADGDGRLSILEYLENTNPLKKDYSTKEIKLTEEGELRLEIKQTIGHDQVYFSAERSDELSLWIKEGIEYRGRINNGDGTETVRFRIDDSVDSLSKNQFLRLSVSEEPETN